jgi:hypothetical protein
METRNNKAIGGVILILIGVMAFAAQIFQNYNWGLWFLLALGVLFIVWGMGTRTVGLLIPGGIVSGLGVGTVLAGGMWGKLNGVVNGGIVVLCLGLGFVSIVPLAMILGDRRQWWSLIPGGILVVIGIMLLAGAFGLQILALAGYLWPLILIAVGVYIIFKRTRA